MRIPTTTMLLLLVGALIFSGAGIVRSDASDHRYKEGDSIPLYANKVGPFHNPSETYRYFDLPFCVPEEAVGHQLDALKYNDYPRYDYGDTLNLEQFVL